MLSRTYHRQNRSERHVLFVSFGKAIHSGSFATRKVEYAHTPILPACFLSSMLENKLDAVLYSCCVVVFIYGTNFFDESDSDQSNLKKINVNNEKFLQKHKSSF